MGDYDRQPDFIFPETTIYAAAGQNGRINFVERPSAGGFLDNPSAGGFGYRTKVDANAGQDLLRGNWSENTLSKVFFSPENVTIIQNALKREVFQRSGAKKYTIDNQSTDDIQIVMRSLYLQYAKNLDYDIPGQVKDLNRLVVDWCVPRILSEIDMYQYYLNDISRMPMPLSQPVNVSSAGTKSKDFRTFM